MKRIVLVIAMVCASGVAFARTLTLEEALDIARHNQPLLVQAQANLDIAKANAKEARSGLLPQLNGTASYTRLYQGDNITRLATGFPTMTTATGTGSATTSSATVSASGTVVTGPNIYAAGLTLTQQIFDFMRTIDTYRANNSLEDAQKFTQFYVEITTNLTVKTAFFTALQDQALLKVAQETLANQKKHLDQTTGFVRAGTHPEIDLAQAKTDYANSKLSLINAQVTFKTAKAELNAAMGIVSDTDYDVGEEPTLAIAGEDKSLPDMFAEAESHRPDLTSYDRQIRADKLLITAAKGSYFPTINGTLSLSDTGSNGSVFVNEVYDPTAPTMPNTVTKQGLVWSWRFQAGINASWNLFSGLNTVWQVREAEAQMRLVASQKNALVIDIRREVQEAILNVNAAIESVDASNEALVNSKEQLRLANGRFQAGVGTAVEFGDAQVAEASAAANAVNAVYTLASRRAQLEKALGRK